MHFVILIADHESNYLELFGDLAILTRFGKLGG